MSTAAQEIVPKPEQEVLEADGSSVESSSETTKEIFRHEDSPQESPDVRSPKIQSPVVFPRSKTTTQSHSAAKTKTEAAKKKSNSGIPLRLKNNPVNNSKTNQMKVGSYRHQQPGQTIANVINKNTLEVQFINNKKRLLQLHADLVERQRPLLDMHKSLLRTKKQLEGLGKKVVLEDLKIMTLKGDDLKTPMEGAGESPAAETAMNLKSSIENVLDSCAKVCQKCLVKRDDVVKMLENVSKSEMNPDEVEAEIEELKRDKAELEKDVESTISENEKKIDELIATWQKTVKSKSVSEEMTLKLGEMEETIKAQQKTIAEAEDNAHITARKNEEKKANYEKIISEWQEKNNKLEEELKKERKNANDNLMKSRNLRSKVAELELKYKEAEEKSIEAVTKLKQLQEQMRKKEVQWIKEKDDFKKNEALLQQKFTEKQSQFDTRLRDMERIQKDTEMQQENFYKAFETQLEIKDQELALLEKEKEVLAEKTKAAEEQLEEMKRHLEEKDREIDELSLKAESIPAIEYKKSESPWLELIEYKQKITEVQTTLQEQTDQISKMQSSLKAHAQLAAALKLENDNVIKYSTKLRDILQEARDELEFKNKTIYKIHEKLVLKEQACKKLKAQLKEYEILHDYSRGEQWHKNRCQICMSSLGGEKPSTAASSSYDDNEVGKSNSQSPQSQYVSESLIGMSVKKVDNLRARLDNLKKLKLPDGSRQIKVNYSWSNQSCQNKPFTNHLGKQIKLRGKLYQILQKHADQSCEDFINLLKLSVSNSGKSTQNRSELKPSNMSDPIDPPVNNNPPRRYSPRKIKITESFSAISQYFKTVPFSDLIDKLSESTEGEMC